MFVRAYVFGFVAWIVLFCSAKVSGANFVQGYRILLAILWIGWEWRGPEKERLDHRPNQKCIQIPKNRYTTSDSGFRCDGGDGIGGFLCAMLFVCGEKVFVGFGGSWILGFGG